MSRPRRRSLSHNHLAGVTSDDLARTKTDLAGRFRVGLATTESLASTILATVHRGYLLSWLDAVTLAQVNGTIKKHLPPESFVLIKAGTVPTVAK